MQRKNLLFPDDVEQFVRKRFNSAHQAWLAAPAGETWPISTGLGSTTEQEAMRDMPAVRAWVNAWRQYPGPGTVEWEERQWSKLGTQKLPGRVSFASAEVVADALGEGSRWKLVSERYAALVERHPLLAGGPLAKHFTVLADYSAEDYRSLVELVDWFARNPASGLYLRQLPIAEVHTKWIEQRKALVTTLVRALNLGVPANADFHQLLGLARVPYRIRLRILCPTLRAHVGGLSDIEAPTSELASLPLRPHALIIVENLETGIALPELPGTVALMKLGHAIQVLEELPWLRDIPRVVYWGDLDTHGFIILDRARRILPLIRSVMMDEATLMAHQSLWVQESTPSSAERLGCLTAEEKNVYDSLRAQRWGRNVRLEQERLPWPEAITRLRAALG